MILIEAGKSTVIVGPPGAYQQQVAFEIAAACGTDRPAFDLVRLPSHGRVAWLVDMRHRAEALYDQMIYWRERKGLPAGARFPILPLYLAPNEHAPTLIDGQFAEPPALIVRDFCPSGVEYDESMPREIGYWLDTTAPLLAKQFGAAILTTITSRLGLQDLAGHADIVLAVEIQHSVGLRLHQVKPESATWLTLQVQADRHGCIVAGFREETLVRGADGEPEIIARKAVA